MLISAQLTADVASS